ncbi:phage coat protein [Stenotrophomonas sp.]|uniref:phage coat protein n=1 Tax=Stenotrophomonas sp. TaxID=69392 RepID=UPI0028AB4C4E|nr:phage coat protein [Stenotrophomonas sp.]
MQAGWMTDLTNWLLGVIKQIFAALWDMAMDIIVAAFERLLAVVLLALSYLPLPDFMQSQSIGAMLANGGSTILWFADLFQIGPSLVLIATAIVFYLLRRILTVGIW